MIQDGKVTTNLNNAKPVSSIRIDKGNPVSNKPLQKVDHVHVTYNGKIVDNTGKNYIEYNSKTNEIYKVPREVVDSGKNIDQYRFNIEKNPLNKAPSEHTDAHIPVEQWLKWKSMWND